MTATVQSENDKKTPPPWWSVFAAVERERFAQLNTYGEQHNLPDGTSPAFYTGWAEEYKRQNDAREAAGKPGVWAEILLEEVFEALSEDDPVMLEDELIQVAAVAVAWVEDLRQRRGAKS